MIKVEELQSGQPLRVLLANEFGKSTNKWFRDWYFATFTTGDLQYIKEWYYADLVGKEYAFYFIPWFLTKFTESCTKYLTTLEQEWQLSTGTVVKAVFPPKDALTLQGKPKASIAVASPVEVSSSTPSTLEILQTVNQVIRQNNFTNLTLEAIGKQLQHLETKIVTLSHKKFSANEVSTSKAVIPTVITKQKPIILHQPPVLRLPPTDQEQQSELLKLLLEKVGKPQVSTITDSPAFSQVPLQTNSEIAAKWQEKKRKQSRPPPFDIHSNQENPFVMTNSYDARTISEWNIDQESPKGVVDTPRECLFIAMYVELKVYPLIGCKPNHSWTYTAIYNGWWYHYLSKIKGMKSLIFVKIDESGDTLLDNDGNPISRCLYDILCLGSWLCSPSILNDGAKTTMYPLHHLRCKTLTDLLTGYISTFRSRVMTLADAANPYWKQGFIEGLPTQFAMKVKEMLRPGPNEEINWNILHYGQLQTACTRQGLLLCNDLRLKKQLKQDQISQRTLGTFCQQFAYENIPEQDCSKCSKNTQPYKRRFFRKTSSKPPFIPKEKGRDTKKKGTKPSSHFHQKDQSATTAKCYKCGRTGHYARTCFARQKQKVQELQIDEQSKQKVLQLLSANQKSKTPLRIEQELREPLVTSSSSSPTSWDRKKSRTYKEDQLEAMFRMTTSLNMISSTDLSALLENLTNQKDKELLLESLLKGRQDTPKYCDKSFLEKAGIVDRWGFPRGSCKDRPSRGVKPRRGLRHRESSFGTFLGGD
ncbi:hypothetical protein H6P81_016291 [Aristolochia fimbriata]|uniref:CCHC-type domain-containing protein n=1 Tax=Aristolochia fimbriata TaxID=158543 RepID=A0AAV7E968_ARIFI|nr:hypothetical protein H6P81_016291 [Aristolochia fimbriata]